MKPIRNVGIRPMIINLGLFFVLISLVFFSVFVGSYPNFESQFLKNILKTELPVLAIADDRNTINYLDRRRVFRTCLNILAGVRLEDPLTYLRAEIPMMDAVPVTADNFDETAVDDIALKPSQEPQTEPSASQVRVDNQIKSKTPLVAIYNTHTSESFELTEGLTHIKGKAGGVSIVAKEIQKALEEYGIISKYSPVLHDLVFNKSYSESQKTVSQLLKDYPGLEMLLDIHRDGSLTREQSIVKINGQIAAKILIVIGTEARADHPKWRTNLEFARKIAAKMDVMYPGLSRGVTIKQGRYNQQFSPHALLIEIGSVKNTTNEAVVSARLFANVTTAVLNDLKMNSVK
jgi:stage II sporulation protein P